MLVIGSSTTWLACIVENHLKCRPPHRRKKLSYFREIWCFSFGFRQRILWTVQHQYERIITLKLSRAESPSVKLFSGLLGRGPFLVNLNVSIAVAAVIFSGSSILLLWRLTTDDAIPKPSTGRGPHPNSPEKNYTKKKPESSPILKL